MAIEDRVIQILAAQAGIEPQVIAEGDLVWKEDGGWLDDDEVYALLDTLEGEFGIDIDRRGPATIDTVEQIIDLVQTLTETRSDPSDGPTPP